MAVEEERIDFVVNGKGNAPNFFQRVQDEIKKMQKAEMDAAAKSEAAARLGKGRGVFGRLEDSLKRVRQGEVSQAFEEIGKFGRGAIAATAVLGAVKMGGDIFRGLNEATEAALRGEVPIGGFENFLRSVPLIGSLAANASDEISKWASGLAEVRYQAEQTQKSFEKLQQRLNAYRTFQDSLNRAVETGRNQALTLRTAEYGTGSSFAIARISEQQLAQDMQAVEVMRKAFNALPPGLPGNQYREMSQAIAELEQQAKERAGAANRALEKEGLEAVRQLVTRDLPRQLADAETAIASTTLRLAGKVFEADMKTIDNQFAKAVADVEAKARALEKAFPGFFTSIREAGGASINALSIQRDAAVRQAMVEDAQRQVERMAQSGAISDLLSRERGLQLSARGGAGDLLKLRQDSIAREFASRRLSLMEISANGQSTLAQRMAAMVEMMRLPALQRFALAELMREGGGGGTASLSRGGAGLTGVGAAGRERQGERTAERFDKAVGDFEGAVGKFGKDAAKAIADSLPNFLRVKWRR